GEQAALLEETSHLLKGTEDILFRCCFCTHITTDPRGILSHVVAHGDEQFKGQCCPTLLGPLSILCSPVVIHKPDTSFDHLSHLNLSPSKQLCLTPVCVRTEPRPYKCQQCTEAFNIGRNLNKCIQTHSDEMPFECKQCPKSFPHSGSLSIHMLEHISQEPCRCELLPKTFTELVHILIYLTETPYKCKLHPQNFRTHEFFTIHIRMHRGNKPYQCKHCFKAFLFNNNFTIHVQMQKDERPHKCELCLESFFNPEVLTRHVYEHTGQKPYQCKHCSKAFAASYSLKDQIRTQVKNLTGVSIVLKPLLELLRKATFKHTSEKPYGCKYCPKSFPRIASLKNHIHTHQRKIQR
ncbi:unnamed protein product, partial [Ixodes persulcatus]